MQVEAVQAEAAADQREPGRDGSRRGRPAGRRRRHAGAVAAPGPRCRCMTTTSSQRSNFQPAAAIVPACAKPSARCTPIEPALARVADHRQHLARAGGLAAGQQLGQQQAAEAAAGRVGGEVDRVFEAEAIGRAGPELVRVGVAADLAGFLEHEPGQALGERRRRGGAPSRRASGGSISKVPVPWRTCQP